MITNADECSLHSVLDLVADFGPGFLTWGQPDAMMSRPVMPGVDRERHRLTLVADGAWFSSVSLGRFTTMLTFIDEFSLRALSLRGHAHRSAALDDITAAWTAETSRQFTDGPQQKGLIALHIVPGAADLWQLGSNLLIEEWRFSAQ